jgi:hypothetical protein
MASARPRLRARARLHKNVTGLFDNKLIRYGYLFLGLWLPHSSSLLYVERLLIFNGCKGRKYVIRRKEVFLPSGGKVIAERKVGKTETVENLEARGALGFRLINLLFRHAKTPCY